MPTKSEIIKLLQEGKISLPPLTLRFLESQPTVGGSRLFDAMVEASWRDSTAKFIVESRSISTPKAFQDGLNLLKLESFPKGYRPLLLMPYLSEKQLRELEREEISGLDLCGNGIVTVPGVFRVFRSGGENRFSSSATIKNIYRKNSSMVGRVFLVSSSFDTVQGICAEINRRNMLVRDWDRSPMTLSTVSKSLKTLEQDLIIERKGTIRLIQPEALLEKLSENYNPPNLKEQIRLKFQGNPQTIRQALMKLSQESGLPLTATGISSVGQYAVMQREEMLSVYCPRVEILVKELSGSRSDRFPNLELVQTEDETVYFDAQRGKKFWWASPVQVYMELMTGDKRDRETAEQVKVFILNTLQAERE